MLIKYIIADDGDEISHPNIYTINSSSSSITLDIIKKVCIYTNNYFEIYYYNYYYYYYWKTFPLPGEYYFRFLTLLGNDKVWLDFNDNNGSSVPLFDGGIFAKVSRLSIGNPMGKSYNSASHEANVTSSNRSIKSSRLCLTTSRSPLSAFSIMI